jgi:hypothetical protein
MIQIREVQKKKSEILQKIEKSFARYWEHVVKNEIYVHPNDLIYKPEIRDKRFETREIAISNSIYQKIENLVKELHRKYAPLTYCPNMMKATFEGMFDSPQVSIQIGKYSLDNLSLNELRHPGYELIGILGEDRNLRSISARGYDTYSSEEIPRDSPHVFLETHGQNKDGIKFEVTRIGSKPVDLYMHNFEYSTRRVSV